VIRYGVIGGGARGQALMDAALKTGEIKISAVADPVEKNRACLSAPGNAEYENHRQMLEAGGIDAVVIASPNDTHCAIALDCLRAHLPVFLEKPVGLTMEEFDLVYGEARRLGSIVQVGVELRFSPLMNELSRRLAQGDVGRLRQITCKEYRPPFRPGEGAWRIGPRNGGTLLEKNVHHFDLFNWFAGSRPVRVAAFGGADVLYRESGVLDNAVVIVEYENGVRAALQLGLFHRVGFHLELGLLGEAGRLEALVPPEKLTCVSPDIRETRVFSRTPIRGRTDHEGEVPQHAAFAALVRADKPDVGALERVRDAHVIALAAQRAIREGEVQRV